MSPETLAAIVAMSLATVATRFAGLIVPAGFARRGRLKAAFEAMPVAVLASIIAPAVLATGWPETVAALITLIVAWRSPLIAVVVVGVVSAGGLRALAPLL
ncbi:AzlD family protein [Reyranella sp.]|uniref:AzlD family protein n=1 Tax=Reyranella sp. TaxID=1929291 RepID=UPI003782DA83